MGCILSLSNYVALSKPFDLSEPPSPPLQNGYNDQRMGLDRAFSERMTQRVPGMVPGLSSVPGKGKVFPIAPFSRSLHSHPSERG